MRFNKEIDRLDQTRKSYPEPIRTNTPPIILSLNGYMNLSIKNLPLEIDKWTFHKIKGEVKEKENSKSHTLNSHHINKILPLIYNLVAVLKSDRNDGITIISNAINEANRPIIAVIHLEKTKQRLKVNDISTIFGRKNLENWLKPRLDNVLYYNPNLKKEKAKELYDNPNFTVEENPLGVVHNTLAGLMVLTPNDIVKCYAELLAKQPTQKPKQVPALQNLEESFYQIFYKSHDEQQILRKLLVECRLILWLKVVF